VIQSDRNPLLIGLTILLAIAGSSWNVALAIGHRRRYHALALEHANRNLIFSYKIASVCGILIGNWKPEAVRNP
jgi:hypothetical protein